MNAYAHARSLTRVRVDWRAYGLVILFGTVIVMALLLANVMLAVDASSPDPSLGSNSPVNSATSSTQAAGGVGWALLEAAFAAVLLVAIAMWRRAPELVKQLMAEAEQPGIWMLVAAFAISVDALWAAFVLLVAVQLANAFDVWWVCNDLLALILAIGLAAWAGVLLGPVFIGIGLVGLSVYDHVFADRETWMFSLADWTVRHKLPLLFVVPRKLRLPWDELVGQLVDDDESHGFGIGTADLLLPAAFIVALFSLGAELATQGAFLGTFIACFRLNHKMEHGSGAGLPALTTGAIGGWAVGAAITATGVALPW